MKHLFGLDLLRFLAAALVVFFHLGYFAIEAPEFPPQPGHAALPFLTDYTKYGWVGVQIFFVISGFVIAASAESSTARSFLIRRAIRVFPALWVCSLLAFSVRVLWGEPLGASLASLLRSVVLSPVGPYVDGIIWTLVVEAVFYAFISVLIVARPRLPQGMPLFEFGAYLLGGASTLFLLAAAASKLTGHEAFSLFNRFFFSILLLRHGVFFALGMLLWSGNRGGSSGIRRFAMALFLVMGCVQILIKGDYQSTPQIAALIWLGALGIIYLSLRSPTGLFPQGWSGTIRQIGMLTYPLYLSHYTIGEYSVPFFATLIANKAVLMGFMIALFLTVAWLVLRYPERWMQTWAKARFTPRPGVASASPAHPR